MSRISKMKQDLQDFQDEQDKRLTCHNSCLFMTARRPSVPPLEIR